MGEFYYRPPDELYHYGIKGMKWGVRKQRESVGGQRSYSDGHYNEQRRAKIKKAAKVGAAVALTAVAAYGAYKYGPKLSGSIAKGSAKVRNRRADPFSGYELRKKGISTFEPNRVEINRGTQASAARQAYYKRHGKSFVSSNITKARKVKDYTHSNYTELGRTHWKATRAQQTYEHRLKLYKKSSELDPNFNKKRLYPEQPKTRKEILTDMIVESRNRANNARIAEQRAVNKAYATGTYKRKKSINYRNLTRRH